MNVTLFLVDLVDRTIHKRGYGVIHIFDTAIRKHTKYERSRLSGFREEDFLRFSYEKLISRVCMVFPGAVFPGGISRYFPSREILLNFTKVGNTGKYSKIH